MGRGSPPEGEPESKGDPASPAVIPPHIFREYDLRGLAGPDLNPATAEHLGRSYVVLLQQLHPHLPSSRPPRVAVGRDVRLSSPSLASALYAGLLSQGVEVLDLGVCPTPLLYFSLFYLDLEGGIMVTGSHNPPEYNGFKMCVGKDTIYGPAIQRLREISSQLPPLPMPPARTASLGPTACTSSTTSLASLASTTATATASTSALGSRREQPIIPLYLSWMVDHFRQMGLAPARGDLGAAPSALPAPLRVVVDAGNGTAGLVAPALLRSLGCQVIELCCQPDGRFPHHHPDPTLPENLQDLIARVIAEKADLGLAFDGDADRLGVVDGSGQIIWGDRLLYVFARDILSQSPSPTSPSSPTAPASASPAAPAAPAPASPAAPAAPAALTSTLAMASPPAPPLFIGEVKCSQAVYDAIEAAGGRVLMSRTGHSPIKQLLKESGAVLAGEMSGHLFFADRYFGYDDAIYAGARLIEILIRRRTPLSSLLADLPSTFCTPEIRLPCPEDRKFALVRAIAQALDSGHHPPFPSPLRQVVTIDGLRLIFASGWALIRASNTQPALVLRFEANSSPDLEKIRSWVEGMVEAAERRMGGA